MDSQYKGIQHRENEWYAAQLQAASNPCWNEAGLQQEMSNNAYIGLFSGIGASNYWSSPKYSRPYKSESMNYKLHKAREWLRSRA